MDEFDEKDPLWDLLGRAKRTEASPYFARKVLRAVQNNDRQSFSLTTFWRWLIPTSAFAAVMIGWSAYHWQQEQSVAEFNEYFDSAADLSSLVAQESTSFWVDTN